ncbi:MAG: hypothetical protein E7013_01365 [Alphaproteobacteria bacterium]|nr:hypothetical protein [Alphaproteobacteria bacterium]
MISLKKALTYPFQPKTYIISFFWMFFYAISLTIQFKLMINIAFKRNFQQSLQQFDIFNFFVYFLIFAYFVTFIYLLITTKKKIFEQPLLVSISFLTKKSIFLLPIFILYAFCAVMLFNQISTASIILKGIFIATITLLSYLFLSFIIAYSRNFNLESVKSLFIPVLKNVKQILLLSVYSAIYIFLAYWIYRFSSFIFLKLIQFFISKSVFIVLSFYLPFIIIFYTWLGKKGRTLFLSSFILVIPSIILYNLIDLPFLKLSNLFNQLTFIILTQLLWYLLYTISLIITCSFSFIAHLLMQVTYTTSMEALEKRNSNNSIKNLNAEVSER